MTVAGPPKPRTQPLGHRPGLLRSCPGWAEPKAWAAAMREVEVETGEREPGDAPEAYLSGGTAGNWPLERAPGATFQVLADRPLIQDRRWREAREGFEAQKVTGAPLGDSASRLKKVNEK